MVVVVVEVEGGSGGGSDSGSGDDIDGEVGEVAKKESWSVGLRTIVRLNLKLF